VAVCVAVRVPVRIDKEKAKKQTISHTRKNKKVNAHVCKDMNSFAYIQAGKPHYT